MIEHQSIVKPPRRKPKYHLPKDILTPDEFRILLKERSGGTFYKTRDRALLTLLYRGGLRITESLMLRSIDFELKEGFVRVHWCKGSKSRIVGIDPQTCTIIGDFMAMRDAKKLPHDGPFFCKFYGQPLNKKWGRQLMFNLRRRCDLMYKRVYLHGLRHSAAYEMVQDGIPIHIISKQLGHARIATTEIYLDHINPKEIIEAARKREWRPR
jgi:integrase/recombinase XerD